MGKKRQAAKDFQKTKLKVGKTKPVLSSATNTKIDGGSLYVPVQSISKNKQDQPKTFRGLTFDELIVQTKHPNVNVRKDALGGLKELHQKYLEFFVGRLSTLFDHSLKLLLDLDSTVRVACISLMEGVFESIDQNCFDSYCERILIFVMSALSHLEEQVRSDGVKILRILLQKFPSCVDQHQERISSGLVFILKRSGSYKEDILTVLYLLIKQMHQKKSCKEPNCPIIEVDSKQAVFIVGGESLSDNLPVSKPFLKGLFCGFMPTNNTHSGGFNELLQESTLRLHDIWAEYSPELMTSSPVKEEILLLIIKITRLVAEYSSTHSIQLTNLIRLVERIVKGFPYTGRSRNNSFCLEINSLLCETVALLLESLQEDTFSSVYCFIVDKVETKQCSSSILLFAEKFLLNSRNIEQKKKLIESLAKCESAHSFLSRMKRLQRDPYLREQLLSLDFE